MSLVDLLRRLIISSTQVFMQQMEVPSARLFALTKNSFSIRSQTVSC